MNDQMAAILEAHREVVVREFVLWLERTGMSVLGTMHNEEIAQAYLDCIREQEERAGRLYDEKATRPTMRHPKP
jgi:hypothetical protein